jgi:hypothetical protein
LIKDRNGLPVEPVRLLPPAPSRPPVPSRPSATPEVQRKRKLDDLTPRIDAFLAQQASASKRPKPELDIAADTATPFSTPVTHSPPPNASQPVDKRSVELAFPLGKCGDAWRERRPERLPGNAVILGRLDHDNLVRVQFYWSLAQYASVGDPDPHVFGPPGSGGSEVWIRIRIRLRILPFSHDGVVWTEIMLAK